MNDFFIGWQKEIPSPFLSVLKRVIYITILLITGLAIILVRYQNQYEGGHFNKYEITEIEGILRSNPLPLLEVTKDSKTQYIVLVSPGKFGAEKSLFNNNDSAIYDRIVSMKGKLISRQGYTLLEVMNFNLLNPNHERIKNTNQLIPKGSIQLTGEIADPKCFLGVMRPGYGATHRDCAIRCISGGITPMLYTSHKNGSKEYYLLINPEHPSITEGIIPYVADQVSVCGELSQLGEWNIFSPDLKTISRIQKDQLPSVTNCH